MTPAVVRQKASPYARKLAKERSLALEAIIGTGPFGRIVAADVLNAPDEPAVRTAGPGPARIPSAFAAQIDLTSLRRFIDDVGAAGLALSIEDIALRAAGRALAELDLSDAMANRDLALETGGRQIHLAMSSDHSVGVQRQARLEALDSERDDAEAEAILSVQFLEAGRVSPVLMPLLPGRALRLRLNIVAGGEGLAALLCADPDVLPDEAAVAFLDSFANAIEEPLRLLA